MSCVPGLRVHRDHQVDAAAARAEMAGLGHPHLVPGRQALDVATGRCCAAPPARPCAGSTWRTAVGAGRARAVDIGELDDEVVDALEAVYAVCMLQHAAAPPVPYRSGTLHVPGAGRAALGAQAAVQADILVLDHDAAGLQRAGDVEVLRRDCAPARSAARAARPPRRSSVKVMQSTGQMSTQASHSMQSLSVNTVCTSQFRQRWASLKASLSIEAELDLGLDVASARSPCRDAAP